MKLQMMSTDELERMIEQIKDELRKRSVSKEILVSIKPTSNSGNRIGWLKKITKVDKTKTNGYAFEGNFIKNEVMLNIGDIVIEQAPAGSAKNDFKVGLIYRVEENEKMLDKDIEICRETYNSKKNLTLISAFDWKKEFLSFRNAVSELL